MSKTSSFDKMAEAAEAADEDNNNIYYDWEMPLDEWLRKYSPSEILKKDEESWIMIVPENFESPRRDLAKLERNWNLLKISGRSLNFPNISELGSICGIHYGMWMIHVKTGVEVESVWKNVATHFVDGVLTNLANHVRVSPCDPNNPKDNHVIIVYNDDCMNEDEVYAVENAIRRAGVTTELKYKPGVYTYLNIYVGNEYNIRPSVYLSEYDAVNKTSAITRLWGNTQ